MIERLKKAGFTGQQLAVEAITLLILLWTIGSLLGSWAEIPAKIPMHFNFAGAADGFGNKGTLAWLLAVNMGIWILMTLVMFLPSKYWNTPVTITPENADFVYRQTRWIVCSSKLTCTLLFAYLLQGSASGAQSLSAWFLPLFLGVEFGSVIFLMVRIVRGAKKIAAENNK